MSMMDKTVTASQQSALATNKVLRNTYTLLSMTLLFSAACAGIAVMINMPPMGMVITLVGYFGLLFLTTKLRNSAWGLVSVFALTGFMGLTLGPIISMYLSIPNGEQIVMTAMGGTGVIFLGLSGYALTTRKDFSFLGGFLMVGILVAFLAGIASMFFSMPGLSLAVSAMFVLLMSGLILYQTSQIIHGGETNYIMATVTLYHFHLQPVPQPAAVAGCLWWRRITLTDHSIIRPRIAGPLFYGCLLCTKPLKHVMNSKRNCWPPRKARCPVSEFMQYLMDTQVFMPVKDSIGIEGFTSSDKAIPLTLKTEDEIEVLILFTSPERSKEFVQEFPATMVVCWPNSSGCWSEPAAASASRSTRTGRWAWTWNRRWCSS